MPPQILRHLSTHKCTRIHANVRIHTCKFSSHTQLPASHSFTHPSHAGKVIRATGLILPKALAVLPRKSSSSRSSGSHNNTLQQTSTEAGVPSADSASAVTSQRKAVPTKWMVVEEGLASSEAGSGAAGADNEKQNGLPMQAGDEKVFEVRVCESVHVIALRMLFFALNAWCVSEMLNARLCH